MNRSSLVKRVRMLLTAPAVVAFVAAALWAAPQSQAAGTGPCDLYAAGGTPCVAAHSTTRALYGSYSGRLYQVRRSNGTTADIGTLSAGGAADGAAQDAFCSGTTCVVTVVYDQSGHGNDLWYQGSSVVPGSSVSTPAVATNEAVAVGGTKVYSLYTQPHQSYWRNGSSSGVPTGSAPEGMYMVTSGTHYNSGCCYDYGNSETTRKADAAGAMDAIYFGSSCWFGGCSGSGPWVQADLEWGLFPGGSQSWNSNQRAFPQRFVTAMLKNNGTSRFAIKGADATGGGLTTMWDGSLPSGYSPMRKQGAIVLGSGGDCCKPGGGANDSAGTFYEGAIVAGYPSDATDSAVQANIVAAGYSASGGGSGGNGQALVGTQSGRCLDVSGASTTNGAAVQLWDCGSAAANQSWTATSSRQLTVYGNKCLDASGRGTTNGTAVVIWDCNGQTNQQWNVNADGSITGVQSGLCLDANGRGTANGTKIVLWACNGQTNQQWSRR